MEKSVFTREYAILLELLHQIRLDAGVSQVELARRLGQSQSFVTKCERGESRLDVVQLRTICIALGTSLPVVVAELEKRLTQKKTKPQRRGRASKR